MAEFLFGYTDDQDKDLISNGGGSVNFGLNENVHITSIMYNPNGSNNPANPVECCDINVDVNGRELRRRIFDVKRVFGKKGEELSPVDPEFATRYAENMKQNMAAITHAVKSLGVTDDQIKALFAKPARDFGDWVQKMISLLPNDYAQRPVDVFLEYQWNISPDQTRTFLEVPKNMKGGAFLVPHVEHATPWKEETSWTSETGAFVEGLRYVDESGQVHPFKRSKNYMESKKAIQQTDEDTVGTGQTALNNIIQQNNNSNISNDLPW